MARVFVHHDAAGRILGIASVELMADELPHPFHLADSAHGVVEIGEGDAALGEGLARLPETHQVDVTAGTLVPKTGTPRRGRGARNPKKTPSREGGERSDG